jgi:hypothetical protein
MTDGIEDRLLAGLLVEGWCWVWTRCRDHAGYGMMRVGPGRPKRVHRLMADLVGLPGDGPFVLHHCDNPPCFNPAHLFRGTRSDNMRDAVAKGRLLSVVARRNRDKTHCMRWHPLAGENLYASLRGTRRCRACEAAGATRRKQCAF